MIASVIVWMACLAAAPVGQAAPAKQAAPAPQAAIPGQEAYLQARQAERTAKWPEALSQYEACVAAKGLLTPYAMVRGAVCRAQGGDASGAMQMFRDALKAYPQGPWVRMAKAELAMLFARSDHPKEAAGLFDEVLKVAPKPAWMFMYEQAAAENLTKIPERRAEGYKALSAQLEAATFRQRRLDAAQRLLPSPDPAHRLAAIAALTRSAEFDAARTALAGVPEELPNDSLRAWRMGLEGRLLTVSGEKERGEALLAETARRYPRTVHAAEALNQLARCQFRRGTGKEIPPEAIQTLDILITLYAKPDGKTPAEAAAAPGDALWYIANALVENGETALAIAEYLLLVEKCPRHESADAALMAVANLYRDSGKPPLAIAAYARLAKEYPASPLLAEASFDSAALRQAQGDAKGALADYVRAASGALGDFYSHRAAESLRRLGNKAAAGPSNLHVAGGDSFVAPLALAPPADPPLPKAWSHAPWMVRLRFFGAHGIEEADWEALSIAETLQLGRKDKHLPKAELLYPILADCSGPAYAEQLAEAAGWDTKEGKPGVGRLRLRYPRVFWETVRATATAQGLDPFLILAVMRQESAFRPTAISRSGATGLMQVMPSTANWLAKVDDRVSADHAARLENPANSLHIGAVYLRRVLDGADGNVAYALAAYNAGPGNLRKWRKSISTKDLGDFIERIPIAETRDYVKKCLANYAAYHSLYPPQAAAPTAGHP